ncbi:MAG: hypothetical protein ACQESG_06550 [Nanobdellota archaeon]
MLARGIIYFETDLETVKHTFQKSTFIKAFFEMDGRPGILIHGDTNLSAEGIVKHFRNQLGVETYADVSVESEDTMEYINRGPMQGTYRGIRLAEYNIEDLKQRLQGYEEDILLRTVEEKDGKPLLCIDIIGNRMPDIDLPVQKQIAFGLEPKLLF